MLCVVPTSSSSLLDRFLTCYGICALKKWTTRSPWWTIFLFSHRIISSFATYLIFKRYYSPFEWGKFSTGPRKFFHGCILSISCVKLESFFFDSIHLVSSERTIRMTRRHHLLLLLKTFEFSWNLIYNPPSKHFSPCTHFNQFRYQLISQGKSMCEVHGILIGNIHFFAVEHHIIDCRY